MSKKYEGFFESEADGLIISALAVLPDEKPYRAVVQLVHGMSEYKERYLPFMEYLAQHGYASVIHDHRGHGKSIREKRDLGYMYGNGAEGMLKDMDTVNRGIRERLPDIPLILMGHSMGSLAVRAYAREHDANIDMLIVCGSPSENPARPFGTFVAKIEQKLFGPRHKSKVIEALSFGSYAAKFKSEKNKHAWVCSDKAVYEEYAASDMCGFTFSDDGYLALFQLMKEAYDVEHWKCTKTKLPILFIAGAEDPCITNVRKFAKAVQAMRRAGYVDVKGKLYPEMRHEILNEKGKLQVYHDVVIYMQKKGF